LSSAANTSNVQLEIACARCIESPCVAYCNHNIIACRHQHYDHMLTLYVYGICAINDAYALLVKLPTIKTLC
jgi:hypothetical protein